MCLLPHLASDTEKAGAGNMAQQLRVLVSLAADQGLDPSTQIVALNQGSIFWVLHTYGA